jgi:hypothetical protein
MQQTAIPAALVLSAMIGGSPDVQAADFGFEGHLASHNSVAKIEFELSSVAGSVRMWTDSFQSGHNFDPTLALWQRNGAGYELVAEVDDDSSLAPGQTDFDAGIETPVLALGRYMLTLSASPNYAAGSLLKDGFVLGGETPIPIAAWNQPGYDINANDQKGSFWRLNLSHVDSAAPVPEPGSYILLAFGIVALWLVRRSQTKD